MTVEIGTAIGQEVGSSVELVSIGGSDAHRAQLTAGLKAAGVTVENAPKGYAMDFAQANASGYAVQQSVSVGQAPAAKLAQNLG